MPDPRVTKLARVLVHYSVALQPGETFCIHTTPLAQELTLAVYKEAVLAGAHVFVDNRPPDLREIFLRHASEEQLDYSPDVLMFIDKEFDALLAVTAPENTRALAGVDAARQRRARRAMAEINKVFRERTERHELRRCITLFPTQALAQEADMSLSDYQDFVYGAGLLDQEDPVAAWKEEGKQQQRLIAWLNGKNEVVIRGSDIDLRFSIRGRTFIGASGRGNFPDGEIYTSPVESSVNGWVRFGYPAIYGGQEVADIELWFEDGHVVKEKARKGQELLTALLDTDDGSRYLGEWGIGTNYGIQRFSKNMLFDEKMGGTIHLALGAGFSEAGGENVSSIHWDMLCDMAESDIIVDGELFYQNRRVLI